MKTFSFPRYLKTMKYNIHEEKHWKNKHIPTKPRRYMSAFATCKSLFLWLLERFAHVKSKRCDTMYTIIHILCCYVARKTSPPHTHRRWQLCRSSVKCSICRWFLLSFVRRKTTTPHRIQTWILFALAAVTYRPFQFGISINFRVPQVGGRRKTAASEHLVRFIWFFFFVRAMFLDFLLAFFLYLFLSIYLAHMLAANRRCE